MSDTPELPEPTPPEQASLLQGEEASEAIATLVTIACGMAAERVPQPCTPEQTALAASTALGLLVCGACKLGMHCGLSDERMRALLAGYAEPALAVRRNAVQTNAKGGDA